MRVRLTGAIVVLLCGGLLVPSSASAVTCDKVGAALLVNLDTDDIIGMTVSGTSIQVRQSGGQVPCTGTPAPTTANIGAILVSNPQGSSTASVAIEDAGDFVGNAIIDGSDAGGATSEIEIYVDLNNASFSVLSIRDRGGFVRFGKNGINPNATPGEVAPDADIFPIDVRRLESYAGTAGNITDPAVFGAQGGAGTGAALTEGLEMLGNQGNDDLTGGEGDDHLMTFRGNDSIVGLAGDDRLQPGEDTDFVSGGPGVDTLDYLLNQNIPSVAVDLAFSGPQNTGGGGTETIVDIENLNATAGPDVVRGDAGPNEIFTSAGNDIVEGRDGQDTLRAHTGEDRVDARDGRPDAVDCGAGDDEVVADAAGVDTLIDCEDVAFSAGPGGGGGGGGGGNTARTFGERTLVSMRLAASRIPAKGPLKVRLANANDFRVVAGVSAKRRSLKLGPRRVAIGPKAARTVNLKLPKALRRLLARQRKLTLRLNVRITDPVGNIRTLSRRLTPRLARR
jgi:Ca2+-binding RTX toxin-like protein